MSAPSPQVGATTERVAVAAEPMAARPAPFVGVTREMSQRADSETYDTEYVAQRVEEDRSMETLANFQKFHPPTFSGDKSDPMVVES